MKKSVYIFSSVFVLVLLFSACQPQVDIEKEKEAIKAVINGETEAYLARDYDLFASYYVQDESNIRLFVSKDTFEITEGWEKLSGNFKESIEDDELWGEYADLKCEKSDFKIKVYSDCAWACNEEKITGVYQGEPFESDRFQIRILEKVEGEWKIVNLTFVEKTSYEEAEENIEEEPVTETE